jgi:hypothetical protein
METGITDAGLVHLQDLAKLRWLGPYWTKVTVAVAKKLRAALPNTFIYHEFLINGGGAAKQS